MNIIYTLISLFIIILYPPEKGKFELENTTWKLLKIEEESNLYTFHEDSANCPIVRFQKLNKKSFGYRGNMLISNNVSDLHSEYYNQPHYLGYYLLSKEDKNYIRLGFINHKSFHPGFLNSEYRKLIRNTFFLDGTYSLKGDSLLIHNEERKLYLSKMQNNK